VASKGGKPFDDRNRKMYAAMVLYLDDTVGELVGVLQDRKMWEDTLVVFLSDNGGPIYIPGSANNYPLKAGKYADFEGGVRTNSFVSGGFIPEDRRGSVHTGVVSIADWYSTFCHLAGVPHADPIAEQAGLPVVDGIPQWDAIANGTDARLGVPLHLSNTSLLSWPWKLVLGTQPYARWQGPLYPNCSTVSNYTKLGPNFVDLKAFDRKLIYTKDAKANAALEWQDTCGAGCLYNVRDDPTEHSDLAAIVTHKQRLVNMQNQLAELNLHLFSPDRGAPSVTACVTALDKGGFMGPFADSEDYYQGLAPLTVKQRAQNLVEKEAIEAVNNHLNASFDVIQAAIIHLQSTGSMGNLDSCNASTSGVSTSH